MQVSIEIKPRQVKRGFTLIEMVGVLGIIAILAAMLIPKIFNALHNSRINNAVQGYNTCKSAAAEYFSKYARFGANATYDAIDGSDAAHTLPLMGWDQLALLPAPGSYIDKPFGVRIGDGLLQTALGGAVDGTGINLVAAVGAATDPDGVNAAYNLDGLGAAGAMNDATGAMVLEAVITGVAVQDAVEVNLRLDGDNLGDIPGNPPVPTGTDLRGRVKYDDSAASPGGGAANDGVVEMHIYLTHR